MKWGKQLKLRLCWRLSPQQEVASHWSLSLGCHVEQRTWIQLYFLTIGLKILEMKLLTLLKSLWLTQQHQGQRTEHLTKWLKQSNLLFHWNLTTFHPSVLPLLLNSERNLMFHSPLSRRNWSFARFPVKRSLRNHQPAEFHCYLAQLHHVAQPLLTPLWIGYY